MKCPKLFGQQSFSPPAPAKLKVFGYACDNHCASQNWWLSLERKEIYKTMKLIVLHLDDKPLIAFASPKYFLFGLFEQMTPYETRNFCNNFGMWLQECLKEAHLLKIALKHMTGVISLSNNFFWTLLSLLYLPLAPWLPSSGKRSDEAPKSSIKPPLFSLPWVVYHSSLL